MKRCPLLFFENSLEVCIEKHLSTANVTTPVTDDHPDYSGEHCDGDEDTITHYFQQMFLFYISTR